MKLLNRIAALHLGPTYNLSTSEYGLMMKLDNATPQMRTLGKIIHNALNGVSTPITHVSQVISVFRNVPSCDMEISQEDMSAIDKFKERTDAIVNANASEYSDAELTNALEGSNLGKVLTYLWEYIRDVEDWRYRIELTLFVLLPEETFKDSKLVGSLDKALNILAKSNIY